MATPRVFTIPASAPFIPTLIKSLLGGTLVDGFPASRDPLALARATLYLPTRRACRLARDMFLDVTGAEAAILPRIVPIGDVDEDEIAFAQAATGGIAAEALELTPVIDGFERRLLLAALVMRWAASPGLRSTGRAPLVATNPAAALALADDLARLMDDMTTRQVSWQRLDDLVPDELDQYWQHTLDFLKIAREHWPAMLAERGAVEPAERRDLLIEAEAKRITRRPDGPVIAAGSTGSMPATAALIATIATLPHGAVVLPGLDTDLDPESWELIAGKNGDREDSAEIAPAAGHPQFAMQALLRRIGIARDDVVTLAEPAEGGREQLVSEAFRPALTTELWRSRTGNAAFATRAERALEHLTLIEAANPEEEALAIAVALREVLDEPGKIAALVTPDRALARRVLAALARWNVEVDDSGGDRLSDTQAGVFARLAAEATLAGLPPVSLLALLKHPLLRLGAASGAHARTIAALERAILRGPRPRPGTDGLLQALASFRRELVKLRAGERSDLHYAEPRTRLHDDDLQAAEHLVVELVAALGPLEGLRAGPHSFAELVERHSQIVATLSDDATGTSAAFAGADGIALKAALDDIASNEPAAGLRLMLGDYPDLFRTAIADRAVRRPGLPGVRVRILGPLEARLTSIDRVVLGSLNEGSWPPDARSDAWLSRPMRHTLGLDLPERRISLTAHDFSQMLGAREVILTRAAKAGGAPTVASRFVQRLAAIAGERWQTVVARGETYRGWARTLDRPAAVVRLPKPAPRPPRAARPLSLSVTDIEHWLRDPYTIYAKYILGLRELDPVDLPPGAADRGIVIHGALSEFTKTFAKGLPDDPERALLEIGQKHFAAITDFPEATAFWWPRFRRIARWFAGWEKERRGRIAALDAEIAGKIQIPVGERVFTLRARADRIERLPGGGHAILDYKTGSVPSEKQVRIGVSPQLTLEAAILRGGGFADMPTAGTSVAELVYVSLKGGAPAGEGRPVDFKDGNADFHADRALAKLTVLATRFEDEQQAYLPLVLSMWKNRYGAYDHLARVKEWSVGGDDEDEGGGEA
jgi:ATP-dependent helicase/nuclease subunit B